MFEQLEELNIWAKMGVCVLGIAIALLLAKYGVARPWYRIVRKTEAEWDDLLFAAFSSRLYIFVVVGGLHLSIRWIDGANGDVLAVLNEFFSVFYIILSTTIASVSVRYIIPMFMDKFTAKSSVTVSGSNPLITFFLRAVIWFAGLYFALQELNIELLGLLASLAIFSIIIGLAVQQTLGNIMNSFMLAIDRPFEVGDRIEVEGLLGSVVSVGILSTKLLTREEKLVVIPNNTLVESTLINHARGGGDGSARRISLVVDVGVDYREDIDHVKYTLLNLAKDCPNVITSPEPRVLLTDLGDYAKSFRLFAWLEDYSEEWVARDWLLKEIDQRFTAENIVIPYPIAVELTENIGDAGGARKASKQKFAKQQMTKADKSLREEREKFRARVEEIKKLLRDPDLSKKETSELEEEMRKLQNALSMFDVDDD